MGPDQKFKFCKLDQFFDEILAGFLFSLVEPIIIEFFVCQESCAFLFSKKNIFTSTKKPIFYPRIELLL